jgi:hypothetical protein
MRPSWGSVLPEMDTILAPLVRGQEVWDLGAGTTLGGAHHLLDLGAAKVIAVDKSAIPKAACKGRPIPRVHSYFHDVSVPEAGIKVALLAWPENHRLVGLIKILRRCETVIYLGSNVGGNACGWSELWDYFHFREVVAYVPDRRNSLIVYGRHTDPEHRRPLLGEEAAGGCGLMVSFEFSEEMANRIAEVVAEVRGQDPRGM